VVLNSEAPGLGQGRTNAVIIVVLPLQFGYLKSNVTLRQLIVWDLLQGGQGMLNYLLNGQHFPGLAKDLSKFTDSLARLGGV